VCLPDPDGRRERDPRGVRLVAVPLLKRSLHLAEIHVRDAISAAQTRIRDAPRRVGRGAPGEIYELSDVTAAPDGAIAYHSAPKSSSPWPFVSPAAVSPSYQ